MKRLRQQQCGVSLISAIFLITALAVLAAMISRTLITKSDETASEWLSTQALYAAESGVQWAAHDIVLGGSGVAADQDANSSGSAWFTTTVAATNFGDQTVYTISSTGMAGRSSANPIAQRTLEVSFVP